MILDINIFDMPNFSNITLLFNNSYLTIIYYRLFTVDNENTMDISVLQDRLNKQQEDNDQERQRLQELVARLETQIREQTRMLEEVYKFTVFCFCK
jgi:hypothetical protein